VAYVILSTIGSLAVLSVTGLLDGAALRDAVALVPVAVVGFGLGALAFNYISRDVFVRLTLILLAAVGLFALVAGLQ
jgi:uncharacterized membrane protein YfcA